jgi:hypothetical protein
VTLNKVFSNQKGKYMKILIILFSLISMQAFASEGIREGRLEINSQDLESHPQGVEGVASLIDASGWKTQAQQQQQQNAQMTRCNVRKHYERTVIYSEAFSVDEILSTGKLKTKRSKAEGLSYTGGSDKFSMGVHMLISKGAKALRLTCSLYRWEWTFWEYAWGLERSSEVVEKKCLNQCTLNRGNDCEQQCAYTVYEGEQCERPSYIGSKGADVYCTLEME